MKEVWFEFWSARVMIAGVLLIIASVVWWLSEGSWGSARFIMAKVGFLAIGIVLVVVGVLVVFLKRY
jgi:hypothetical protein